MRALPTAGHLAARKGDIGHGIELLGRVDHTAAAQDQIERHRISRYGSEVGPAISPGKEGSFALLAIFAPTSVANAAIAH
ncbi:hypothetical protein ACVWW2_000444 [Bradyrhizobium sp. LM4.3]